MVCTTRGFKFWSKQKWFGAKVFTTTAFAVVVVIARVWSLCRVLAAFSLHAEKSEEGNAFG